MSGSYSYIEAQVQSQLLMTFSLQQLLPLQNTSGIRQMTVISTVILSLLLVSSVPKTHSEANKNYEGG